ncbi:hypothetical protein [Paraburkholderia sp. UCT2]|uniref:hypothetical protein n=1 Tax=Paraburkholderia sp. UCT2 TaxID=2615208 RepID=UPI0016553284|nr:hypothetical protein [Paraburkholderia sp. UCT2]MBC8732607.1 hypothetical protein [Paraburkholderia sp. UCT2]
MLTGLFYMRDSYWDRTKVSLGPIEAYARRHLRVAGITGTAITLSLLDARDEQRGTSPLLNLKEGVGLEIAHLSALLPSIATVVWDFSSAPANGTSELVSLAI